LLGARLRAIPLAVRRLGWVALVAGTIIGCAGTAHAGDGESALSISLGGATWWVPVTDDPQTPEKEETIGPTVGGALAVEYERGFAEAFSWRVAGGGGLFGRGGLSGGGWATGGLVYRFDVLKYVPYAVGGVGGIVVAGGPLAEAEIWPAVEVGLGLDILTGRTRSWGVEARVVTFPGELLMGTLGIRGTHRWGFF
jgi:hypothetical protein